MKTIFFKLSNKTRRKPSMSLQIRSKQPGAHWWDVCKTYNDGEIEWDGSVEMVIAYDVASLVNQFSITPRKAKELSEIFSDLT